MNGVTIIDSTAILAESGNPSAVATWILIVGMIMFSLSTFVLLYISEKDKYISEKDKETCDHKCDIILFFIIWICGLILSITACLIPTEKEISYMQYEVAISDDVLFNEFYQKYEIVEWKENSVIVIEKNMEK